MWEYKVVTFHNDDDFAPYCRAGQRLEYLGNEGWELVAITPIETNEQRFFFKRPITINKIEAKVDNT